MRSLSLRAGREGVGHVGAAHALQAALAAAELVDAGQVGLAQRGAALADALGAGQDGIHATPGAARRNRAD
jgi:hypothetical protein